MFFERINKLTHRIVKHIYSVNTMILKYYVEFKLYDIYHIIITSYVLRKMGRESLNLLNYYKYRYRKIQHLRHSNI